MSVLWDTSSCLLCSCPPWSRPTGDTTLKNARHNGLPHTDTDKTPKIRIILSLDCICKGGVEIPVKKVDKFFLPLQKSHILWQPARQNLHMYVFIHIIHMYSKLTFHFSRITFSFQRLIFIFQAWKHEVYFMTFRYYNHWKQVTY